MFSWELKDCTDTTVWARCVTQDIAVVWCCNSADRAESRFGWRTAACPAEMLWAGMSVLLCRLCLEDVPLALSHPSITGLIRAGWAPGRQDKVGCQRAKRQ